jgi:hypothetical protein
MKGDTMPCRPVRASSDETWLNRSREKVTHTIRRPAYFIVLAAALLATVTPARAQQPRQATPDDVCNILAAYAKMGVGHDQIVPLMSDCGKSALCVPTRQAMITAMRDDFDTLNCDHAPPPNARDACSVLISAGMYLGNMSLGSKPPSFALANQLIEKEIVELTPLCKTNPDPELACQALDMFNSYKLRAPPDLVCKR